MSQFKKHIPIFVVIIAIGLVITCLINFGSFFLDRPAAGSDIGILLGGMFLLVGIFSVFLNISGTFDEKN